MENEQKTVGEFLQERRTFILGAAIALVAVVVGISAFLLIRDAINKKTATGLEKLITRYEKLKPSFDAAKDSAGAEANADTEDNADKLLEDLLAFAGKNSGYMPARANSMAAGIYAARKNWKDAEEAYLNSAKKAGKTFLAPISYFNAAVCAEEAGKTDEARAYWTKSLSFADFPLAARAQFSLSRMLDAEGKTDEALAAYRLLIEKYEKEEEWKKLAQSRILMLEQKGE